MKKIPRNQSQVGLQPIAQLLASGHVDAAEQQLRLLLRKTPQHADAQCMLGDVLYNRGNFPAAADAYQRSLSLRVSAASLRGLGAVAEATRQYDAAESCYRHWGRLDPASGEASYRLAAVLNRSPGKAEEVIQQLTAAIAKGWRVQESYLLIAHLARQALKNYDMAYNACRQVLALNPGNIDAMLLLADLYIANNYIQEARDLLQQAIQLNPQRGDIYQVLSNALLKVGRHDECLQLLRQAIELAPGNLAVYSNYLFASNYTETTSQEQTRAVQMHYEQLVNTQAGPLESHKNSPDPARKLRLGIVSADLREHSVAYFVEPLLRHLDRSNFDVYCYYSKLKRDTVTDQLQQLADYWRDVAQLNDVELAQQIRVDGIDLLFDLSNHSADNRLSMFARRPAPVQLSWLGYASSTGLSRIDYIISDPYYTPDASDTPFCSEQPLLLQTYRAFTPSAALQLPVTPLPAEKNGYLTFGSFNSFVKISGDVLQLWAELLLRLPDAKLILIVQGHESIDYVKEFFSARGVDSSRLQLFTKLPLAEFLALHHQVDIALDTFPFAGMTTSMHGLWMGVPMLTLAGERMLSRSGLSLLAPLGLAETFVAGTRAEYIDKALYWAQHIPQLAALRQQLRDNLINSPLMDGAAFSRDLEQQLRRCWQRWCQAQQSLAAPIASDGNQP